MPTELLGLLNTLEPGDPIPSVEIDRFGNTTEAFWKDFVALSGSGILQASDFNASQPAPSTLTSTLSSGRAIIGSKPVDVANPQAIPGLVDNATNWVYVNQAGAAVVNQTGVAPANTELVATIVFAAGVGTVNQLPLGRRNIKSLVTALSPSVTFSVGAESANQINVTVQFYDARGVAIAERLAAMMWLGDAANSAETGTAPDGGWTAVSGVKLADEVTAKRAIFCTGAAGSVVVGITHSLLKTYYLHVLAGCRVYVSPAISFAV